MPKSFWHIHFPIDFDKNYMDATLMKTQSMTSEVIKGNDKMKYYLTGHRTSCKAALMFMDSYLIKTIYEC